MIDMFHFSSDIFSLSVSLSLIHILTQEGRRAQKHMKGKREIELYRERRKTHIGKRDRG